MITNRNEHSNEIWVTCPCLICDASVGIRFTGNYNVTLVCDECKAAIKELKAKRKDQISQAGEVLE